MDHPYSYYELIFLLHNVYCTYVYNKSKIGAENKQYTSFYSENG